MVSPFFTFLSKLFTESDLKRGLSVCPNPTLQPIPACGGIELEIVLYKICYLRTILCYSTLPKMVSSKLLTDFQMRAMLLE